MHYDLDWLIDRFRKGKKIKYIFFWGHRALKNEVTAACFSQWFPSPFKVQETIYPTAEHWMMGKKALLFQDQASFNKILKAKSPGEAKALGRQVNGFDEKTWILNRNRIVLEGSLHKFSQNPPLKTFLLNTKDRVIVEASPKDSIWGVGLSVHDPKIENPLLWNGLNLLGFALMQTRDWLKN